MAFIDQKTVVITYMTIKPDSEEQFLQIFTGLSSATLEEEGCIDYKVHKSVSDKNLFLLYGEWSSEEAYGKHKEFTHFKDFAKRVDTLLSGEPEVSMWKILN